MPPGPLKNFLNPYENVSDAIFCLPKHTVYRYDLYVIEITPNYNADPLLKWYQQGKLFLPILTHLEYYCNNY